MRKLINNKIRNTDRMIKVVSREGNPNDCYSIYSRIMLDNRDGTYYLWTGHFWSGLGSDNLTVLEDILLFISESGWSLDEREADYIEKLCER